MQVQGEETFLPLIPPGWFKSYLDAMVESKNEMPLPFHFLAGAAVIGNMIGLRAWGTLAKGVRVYPNLSALLLSPAGKCRRGEGTKITMAIARRAGINSFAGRITPEGLADELMDNGNLVLYVEELSMLLTKQDFMLPMIPTLTKLLLHGEGEAEVRTRAMGERRTIPYVNLTAIFTSAPDWFVMTIPEAAYGGGMMSRFLVCCLDDRETYHIDITAADTGGEMMDVLADELRQVGEGMEGHVRGDKQAQAWIAEWYYDNERKPVDDARFLPYRNRKPAMLLRVAMILAAAAGVANINRGRLEEALEILNWMEPTLTKLWGTTDALLSRATRGERRILQYLSAADGRQAMHADMIRAVAPYFQGGVQEIRRCLDGMREKGLVTSLERTVDYRSWPPRGWELMEGVDEGYV